MNEVWEKKTTRICVNSFILYRETCTLITNYNTHKNRF